MWELEPNAPDADAGEQPLEVELALLEVVMRAEFDLEECAGVGEADD